MLVKKLVVGSMATNCYLLFDRNSRKTVIVDPGDDAEYIKETVSDLNLLPVAVIATHKHPDHTGAGVELGLVYRIPFYIGYPEEKIYLGDLKIIKTPGHTGRSISLYSKKGKFAIVGDIDSTVCNPELFKKSLAKLAALPKDTRIYQGHGPDLPIDYLNNLLKSNIQTKNG
jgi:hydroxyacylglutathione hydrolase